MDQNRFFTFKVNETYFWTIQIVPATFVAPTVRWHHRLAAADFYQPTVIQMCLSCVTQN